MPTPIPELQMMKPATSNFAEKMLQLMQYQRGTQTSQNEYAVKMAGIEDKRKADTRRQSIDANDFALNLLSGINSEEDLTIAKRQFSARYPERAMDVDRILPYYNPRSVELIRNSLRTETMRLKQEELTWNQSNELKGFAPGTAVFKGGEEVGIVPKDVKEDYELFTSPEGDQAYVKKGDAVPKGYVKTEKDLKEDFEVFEGPEGEQVYVKKGGAIPKGFKKVQTKGTAVTVNTGDLAKTTKSKLEDDIVEATRNIQSFKATRASFKPEYLTLFGKAGNFMAESADKAGVSTADQKKLISERSTWFRQAKADFIAYRKWATGVAGGEKEMAEIATSFPDPVKNSPTQYIANLKSIDETTKRVLSLNAEFLRSGIDLSQPIESILKQARGLGVATPPASGGGGGGKGSGGGSVTIIQYDAEGKRVSK